MPAPTDSNGNSTLLPPISAVATSALLEPRQDNEGFSPSPSYGAFVPVADNFLPLGGGGDHDNEWGDVGRVYATDMTEEEEEEVDPDRISATTLIYLCALCSSLTSVLLGYGKRNKRWFALYVYRQGFRAAAAAVYGCGFVFACLPRCVFFAVGEYVAGCWGGGTDRERASTLLRAGLELVH